MMLTCKVNSYMKYSAIKSLHSELCQRKSQRKNLNGKYIRNIPFQLFFFFAKLSRNLQQSCQVVKKF